MMNVGAGDFSESGRAYLPLFVELAGLTPAGRVLDVGCGIGHIAVALAEFMDTRGSYEGFDIVEQGISWCQKAITPRYPNFQFRHVDVFNREYNPKGSTQPSDFSFPYGESEFDLVLLTSVFTHMRLDDIDRYLAEIHRVLKTNGRCLATFFLLETSLSNEGGDGFDRFSYPLGASTTIDNRSHEKAIAHQETAVREAFSTHSFRVQDPIRYGNWRASSDLLGSQDIIVAQRFG
jgi:ubiquinone/menaquinone biosynthesis C-methylase UbiE